MVRLLALLLLSWQVHAAPAVSCWDGSFATGGACPVRPLSITPDLDPGETTVTITCTLEASADTLYIWAKEATSPGVCPTAPTVSQIIAGTGDPDATGTDGSPSAGANTVELTGLTVNTEYCAWCVASKNGIPSVQTSANSQAFVASIPWFTAAVPGGLVKWNPGHYYMPSKNTSGFAVPQNESQEAARDSEYAEWGSGEMAAIRGVTLRTTWGVLERNTRGNYTEGFAWVQGELDTLAELSVPKRLWLRIQTHVSGSSAAMNQTCDNTTNYSSTLYRTTVYPRYVTEEGNAFIVNNGAKCIMALWEEDVADDYILMLEALGAEFDGHPLLEGVTINKELALGSTFESGSGYTSAKWITQLARIAAAAKAAFPTTNVVIALNGISGGSFAQRNAFIGQMLELGVGIGGPDLAPSCVGGLVDCSSGFPDPQTSDLGLYYQEIRDQGYPGVAPIAFAIETSELGNNTVGQNGGYTPGALSNFCTQFALGCTHLHWGEQLANVLDAQEWDPSGAYGIRDWIADNPSSLNVNAGCPSEHVAAGGCLTGGLPD